MKYFMLLAFVCFTSSHLSASDNYQKEKKALIKTIETNYDSWMLKAQNHESETLASDVSADNQSTEVSTLKASLNPSDEDAFQKHIFSNYHFKIIDSQAIVKFTVDNKLISAFFEKKNEIWQLVCAADITLDI